MDDDTKDRISALIDNAGKAWSHYVAGTYLGLASEHLDGVRTLLVDALAKIEGGMK